MYAIVKTGGKQYRVQQGQSLLIERLPGEAGDTVDLRPLLFVDGDDLVDGEGLSEVSVEATILAQERGPKLRIVKFKPKRGYKRRTGHRQELTRIEISTIGRKKPRRRAAKSETAPKPVSANPSSGADDGS
jgi:large subunit ribosomal protein L21